MSYKETDGLAISTWGVYNSGDLEFKHFYFSDYSTAQEMIDVIDEYVKTIDEDPEVLICDTEDYSGFLSGVTALTSHIVLIERYFNIIDYVDLDGLDLLDVVKSIEGYWDLDYLAEYEELTQENINNLFSNPFDAMMSFGANSQNNIMHQYFRLDGYGNIETISEMELIDLLSRNKVEILNALEERM